MPYVVARGNALLVPSGSHNDPNRKHLFVVLTESCPAGEHLLVSVSSIKPNVFHDPACLISAGEHPFITVASFVEYRLARTIDAAHIVKCVDGWLYTPREPVSPPLLQRMCDGVELSRFVPKRVHAYYLANKSRGSAP
jgi:hypothetical protein